MNNVTAEDLKELIRSTMQEQLRNELGNFKEDLKREIREEFINEYRREIDGIQEECRQLKQHCSVLESKVAELEKLQRENYVVRAQMQDLNQYTRRNNVIVSGVVEIPNEKPLETLQRIATIMNYDLDEQQIEACHRLPVNRWSVNRNRSQAAPPPRPFILKFVRRYVKTDFIIHCKSNRKENIFVNEHLK